MDGNHYSHREIFKGHRYHVLHCYTVGIGYAKSIYFMVPACVLQVSSTELLQTGGVMGINTSYL